MKLTALPLTELLAAFRSAEPTPGGGSAAALAGAVGASLLAMVAGLPRPAAAGEEETGELLAAGERCAALARRLEELIDRDSESYDGVVAAFRLPKGTDEEKAMRTRAIQEALTAATETPLDVMRLCAEGLDAASGIARLGNPNAASDVQVGIGLLAAGLRGAHQNVEINLGSLKDAEYVTRVRGEAGALLAKAP
ncbi:MAG TPA: cyclodeaminase/cyclohydrolase family protein [Vicinamibacterales bacterium]|nr:cyclodeaminase/cyclohydrolase family protein [Vicinamibacterales bacterium]